MNKIFAILIFLMAGLSSFAQSDTETDKLIDSLSWKSITMSHSYHTFTLDYQDSTVKELIKIGKPAKNGLLKDIKIPDKTVIIHIILTNIYEPENGNNNLPISYIYKDCDDLIGWHHVYNGLIWEWYSDSNFTISEPEIDKIHKYWSDRLNDKIKPWQNDINETFNVLQSADSIKYPCYRVYDNNSDKLSINQLVELLNTKYPSKNFDTIFKILGNDSVVTKYDDCFYISYGADGIDFRFDKDGYLTTLFFEPVYKSDLISNIKLTDTKQELLSKLGSPDKQRENWIWYDKYGLGIDFYDDNKIKNLQINRK